MRFRCSCRACRPVGSTGSSRPGHRHLPAPRNRALCLRPTSSGSAYCHAGRACRKPRPPSQAGATSPVFLLALNRRGAAARLRRRCRHLRRARAAVPSLPPAARRLDGSPWTVAVAFAIRVSYSGRLSSLGYVFPYPRSRFTTSAAPAFVPSAGPQVAARASFVIALPWPLPRVGLVFSSTRATEARAAGRWGRDDADGPRFGRVLGRSAGRACGRARRVDCEINEIRRSRLHRVRPSTANTGTLLGRRSQGLVAALSVASGPARCELRSGLAMLRLFPILLSPRPPSAALPSSSGPSLPSSAPSCVLSFSGSSLLALARGPRGTRMSALPATAARSCERG